MDMIERCNLNRLTQFAAFLSVHLQNSRRDNKLLAKLQGLDEVLYSGLPLPRDDEEWALKNGIKLKVSADAYSSMRSMPIITSARIYSEAQNVAPCFSR